MELVKVTKEEYINYYKGFPISHFMQSAGFGDVNSFRNYEVSYLALLDNNNPLALMMVGKKKVLNYNTFYCPRGILVDYSNTLVLDELFKQLKVYLKKEKALYFKMDPGVVIRTRDLKSEVKEEFETINYIKTLESYGFKHRGFSYDLVDSSQPRFTFKLNLEKDETEILKGMNSYNRNILKKDFNELVITKNDFSKFPLFYDTMKDTAIRENLYLPDISYYENFYKSLKHYEQADLYTAEVNIDSIISKDLNKIKELKSKIETINNKEKKSAKDDNTILEANGSINKLNKELEELNPYKGRTICLSSVVTAKDGDKVWIIYGGNKDILKNLNVNYHLYWYVIKDAKKQGYRVIDFFGTHGKPPVDHPEYGLFLYKSKFGGDFVEFIGEFDLVINPMMNKILMSLVKLRRKAIRLVK